jgi:RHS repeat-associated protein
MKENKLLALVGMLPQIFCTASYSVAQILKKIAVQRTLRNLAAENMAQRMATAMPIVCLALLFSAGSVSLQAQAAPDLEQGLKPYGSYQGGNLDSVSLSNGNLFFHAGLLAYSQRAGELAYPIVLQYNNENYSLYTTPPCNPRCPVQNYAVFGADPNTPQDSLGAAVSIAFEGPLGNVYNSVSTGLSLDDSPISVNVYSVQTPDGSQHQMVNTSAGSASTDGSAFYANATVHDRKGSTFTAVNFPPSGSIADANGNQLTGASSGWTDTLGRQIPLMPGPVHPADTPAASTASLSACPALNYANQPVNFAYTWSLPTVNAGTLPLTLCYASVWVHSNFYGSLGFGPKQFDVNQNFTMLQSVVFPDGTYWAFAYDAAVPNNTASYGYGDLLQITFPTGGTLSYVWSQTNGCMGLSQRINRVVTMRTVNANDGSGAHSSTYSYSGFTNSLQTVTVTDPAGNDTVHSMTGLGSGCSLYETQVQAFQGSHTSGTLLQTVTTDYQFALNPYDSNAISSGNVNNAKTVTSVFPIRVTTTLPNGMVRKAETDYDAALAYHGPLDGIQWNDQPGGPINTEPVTNYTGSYGKVVAQREYDWGQGAPGALLRQTLTTYQWQANSAYLSANLLDLPATVIVKDGNGCALAETDYTYDESAYLTASNISTQHGNPPSSVRGNLTTVTRWLAATSSCNPKAGTSIVTHTNWYDTGEAYQQIDARGNTTTHSYDTAYAGAYPTKTCNALNQCVSGAYDFNTGLTTSFTDANGQTSNFAYDPRWRLTKALATTDPMSGLRPETDFDYSVVTQVKRSKLQTPGTQQNPGTWIVDYAYFDGLGRTKQTRLVDPEGDDLVEMTYDGLGRVATVSNPHRSASSPTDGITTNAFDALGRVTKVTKQDGSVVTTQYDQISANSANGVCTTATDEAGKQRKSCVDGLARLIEVDEPQASTGSLSNAYITFYSYDALGNLLQVNQKGDGSQSARVRTFTYDSFSRLLTANNPESGTISYQYDANGNLLQKTSPAPNQTGTATQTISYCYDALNRETGRAYSAQSCSNGQLPSGTAVDSYTYDQGTNGIGHLTSWTDPAGTGSYSFDVLGRMASDTRSINGVSKSMSYGYNLDGSMKTLTYPSGAVITYTPDTAGRILSAVDNGNAIKYATGAAYSPPGSITGFVSGNSASFAGITNSFNYNQRLQPINMSATSPSATVFSLNYDFHSGNGNNGNVFGITNNKDTSRNQTFAYDALNRLTSAQNAGTDCTKTLAGGKTEYWGNNYSYDAWGNLLTKSPTKCSAENLNESADVQNRMHVISGPDYSYDAAGNMTHDATNGFNYSYDQENRIAGAGGFGFAYTYDAEGNRVEKANGSTGTLYWYMSPGIVAESDLSGNLQSEYVFFDGERVARKDFPSNAVSYYFSDHLMTTDIVTDAQGNIENESDFYPWGGELQFASNDSNHYKFTGKERDSETGLDYFGARYYSNGLGRFITPDWSKAPVPVPYADLNDPQSLNQYTYVRNIPTTRFDADGHKDDECGLLCRVKQRFHNSNIGLGFRTDAEVKETAKNFRESAGEAKDGGQLIFYHRDTGQIETYSREQLDKMSDAQVVQLNDRIGPTDPGSAQDANTVSQALGIAAGASSQYQDITKGGSVRNVQTDVKRADFESNLSANGWKRSTSKDGLTTIFEKDGARYVVRDNAKSTGTPTADYYAPGSGDITLKIRMPN